MAKYIDDPMDERAADMYEPPVLPEGILRESWPAKPAEPTFDDYELDPSELGRTPQEYIAAARKSLRNTA